MGVMAVGKNFIKSNADAAGNGLFSKYFGTHGKGVGLVDNAKGLKQNGRDMRNADAVLKANPKGESVWQSRLKQATDAGDAQGIQQAQAMLQQIGREKVAAQAAGDNAAQAIAGNIKGLASAPLRYMGATDMRGQSGRFMTAAARTGAIGAGYMGANAGLRYISGGGMTYNNSGERDIAGIPFL